MSANLCLEAFWNFCPRIMLQQFCELILETVASENISPPDIVAVRLWRTKQEEDGGVFGFRAELSFRLRSEWNIADWRLDATMMCPHTSQKTLKIHRCSCGIYILKCLLINLDFTDYLGNKKTKKYWSEMLLVPVTPHFKESDVGVLCDEDLLEGLLIHICL